MNGSCPIAFKAARANQPSTCRRSGGSVRSSAPSWRSWQLWVLRQGPVVVVVTLVHGPEVDPELTTLCRMVLQSIEFAEAPADPPNASPKRVLELARRRFPLLDMPARRENCRSPSANRSLNLFNFYRSYVRTPERFEEIVLPALTTVVQVQEWGDAQTRPPLERRPRPHHADALSRDRSGRRSSRGSSVRRGWPDWPCCTSSMKRRPTGTSRRNCWRDWRLTAERPARPVPGEPGPVL